MYVFLNKKQTKTKDHWVVIHVNQPQLVMKRISDVTQTEMVTDKVMF